MSDEEKEEEEEEEEVLSDEEKDKEEEDEEEEDGRAGRARSLALAAGHGIRGLPPLTCLLSPCSRPALSPFSLAPALALLLPCSRPSLALRGSLRAWRRCDGMGTPRPMWSLAATAG